MPEKRNERSCTVCSTCANGGKPRVLSREGRATVRGSLGGYDVRAEGRLADARENETRFSLAGRGDSYKKLGSRKNMSARPEPYVSAKHSGPQVSTKYGKPTNSS